MDIDKLEAGPELDALVAEKIFGIKQEIFPEHDWRRTPTGEIDEFAMDGDTHNGPECVRCGHMYCVHCLGMRGHEDDDKGPCTGREPRAYSSDIVAAWAMVEKLGGIFGVEYKPHYRPEPWMAVFAKPGMGGTGFGKTAPLAICRAALKALDVK